MNFALIVTITSVIALTSLLSPFLVAIINNRHNLKIKILELKHDEYIREIDLKQHIIEKEMDIYYTNKRNAFINFVNKSGDLCFNTQSRGSYDAFQASSHEAMLFCDSTNLALIKDFVLFVDTLFGNPFDIDTRKVFSEKLNILSESLNMELKTTSSIPL